MVDWNDIETTPCNECGSDDWTRFYTDEPERSDPRNAAVAHYECAECRSHGRIYSEGDNVQRTGAMR